MDCRARPGDDAQWNLRRPIACGRGAGRSIVAPLSPRLSWDNCGLAREGAWHVADR